MNGPDQWAADQATANAYTSITLRTRFEAAHRSPHLGGRCANLHGHSFTAHLTLTTTGHPAPEAGPIGTDDIVTDLGPLKARIQGWVDDQWDHATLLGAADPLARVLTPLTRIYTIGNTPESRGLFWPTIESLAHILGRIAADAAADIAPHTRVSEVSVRETENNTAAVHYPHPAP